MNYISDKIKVWNFPEDISFESVPGYLNSFAFEQDITKIVFDLSNTESLHASFVGFLLHIKNNVEENNSVFQLILSPSCKRILKMMKLYDHFCEKQTPAVIIRTA